MHAAPAVGVRCGGGVAWRAVQSLLPGLAAAAVAAWALQHAATDLAWPGAALAAACAAVPIAARSWRRAAPQVVELRWDGTVWTVDGTAGVLDVMIDLGGWLLLRLRPPSPGRPGCGRWIAVTAAEAAGAWPALRAAAYAGGAREAAPRGDRATAAR